MSNYEERLTIPIIGDSTMRFFTIDETLMAKGYTRIVIGGRGPYIEFTREQICYDNLIILAKDWWRKESDVAYYHEYHSNDNASVKVYEQKRLVDYADYKIGMFYITPFDLFTLEHGRVIWPLKDKKK